MHCLKILLFIIGWKLIIIAMFFLDKFNFESLLRDSFGI